MDAPSSASGDLDRLIAPLTPDAFFADYFERDVLHVARDDRDYFGPLYGVRNVEDALVLGADDPSRFALVKHGAPELAPAEFARERRAVRGRAAGRPSIDVRSVLAAVSRGYTLVVKDAAALDVRLAACANRIAARWGVHVQANAYFTPPRAHGFGVHYDTHDTLIVQIEGRKEWQVFEPLVPLPLETQPFSAALHAGRLGARRRIRLDAGDTLYVPRGFAHDAATTEERSLHLTFSLSPLRIIDVLDALVQLAARGHVDLRRALPVGWRRDPAFAERTSALLGDVLPALLTAERVALAAQHAADDFFPATRTMTADAFDAVARSSRLEPNTRIELRDDAPHGLRESGERLEVHVASDVVNLPIGAAAGFARLQAGPATVAEIETTLGDGTAAAFIGVLAAHGLIRMLPPEAKVSLG